MNDENAGSNLFNLLYILNDEESTWVLVERGGELHVVFSEDVDSAGALGVPEVVVTL